MQINSINNSYNVRTNFKSTFPVVHWVAEANGSFAPITELNLVKKLQGKLVRALNKNIEKSTKPMQINEQKVRSYLASTDIDYREIPHVRSFYSKNNDCLDSIRPISYIISGGDVGLFEEYLAKNIGRAKSNAVPNCYNTETATALKIYNEMGLEFVKQTSKQIYDNNHILNILHTKFEIVRNKLGKIKDYKLLDVRFLPSIGKNNPLERLSSR